ncbi:MAG: hypothetical protein ACKVWV_20335 [Planctomycetota bacterium]
MSAPFTRERTWAPTASETFDVGVARWVRVHDDVPAGLVLRTLEGDGVFDVEPGRVYDFGDRLPSVLTAPATADGSRTLTVCTGSSPVGMTELGPRGGAPRPWLEHLTHGTRTIAAGASFPMVSGFEWIPYSTTAGRALSHPFSRFLIVAAGDRAFDVHVVDTFDASTPSALLATGSAVARPGGLFSLALVLDFPYPRLRVEATNTGAVNLDLQLHLYGTR